MRDNSNKFDLQSSSPMDQTWFKDLQPWAKESKLKNGRTAALIGGGIAIFGIAMLVFTDAPSYAMWLMAGIGLALLVFGGTELLKGMGQKSCTLVVARDTNSLKTVLVVKGQGVQLEVWGPFARKESVWPTGTVINDTRIMQYMVNFQGSKGNSVTLYDRVREDKVPGTPYQVSKSQVETQSLYYHEDLNKVMFVIEEMEFQS